MSLLLLVYFAGTAPHLPNDVAAMGTRPISGGLAPITVRSLGPSSVLSSAEASSGTLPLESNELSPRPIDISDRPTPDRPVRRTRD